MVSSHSRYFLDATIGVVGRETEHRENPPSGPALFLPGFVKVTFTNAGSTKYYHPGGKKRAEEGMSHVKNRPEVLSEPKRILQNSPIAVRF